MRPGSGSQVLGNTCSQRQAAWTPVISLVTEPSATSARKHAREVAEFLLQSCAAATESGLSQDDVVSGCYLPGTVPDFEFVKMLLLPKGLT